MLKFLSFIFLSFTLDAFACEQTKNSKEVMFFVDVNLSFKEVETARKDACKRGERFVLLPDDEKINKVREDFYKFKMLEDDIKKNCPSSTDECREKAEQYKELDNRLIDFDFSNYRMSADAVKAQLKKIKDTDSVVSTLIVSGHDGGGEFSGDLVRGRFTKNDFFKSFDEIFDLEEKKKLQSIFLWGCYTGTISETAKWKANFPGAKSIVGFYDSAPLAIRPASYNLLSDYLNKEELIYSAPNVDKLKETIQSLQSYLSVQPGLLVNACGEDDLYLAHYRNKGEKVFVESSGKEVATNICSEARYSYFRDFANTLKNYLEGEVELPQIIRGSDLRSIYALVRQNEDCFEELPDVNANQIGLLLFWGNVNKNFARKYQNLLKQALLEASELKKSFKNSSKLKIEMKELLNDQGDFEGLESFINAIPTPEKETFSRTQLVDSLRDMNNVFETNYFQKNRAKFSQLEKAYKLMDKMLYQLDPSCMNFLEWHDYNPSVPAPENLCGN